VYLRKDIGGVAALQLAEENIHFMDLGELAAGKPGVQKRAHQWGLESLALQFPGEILLKGNVARSNWERQPALSPTQVEYAANDAGIALPIYVALEPPDLVAIPEGLRPSGLAGAAQRAGTALQQVQAADSASTAASASAFCTRLRLCICLHCHRGPGAAPTGGCITASVQCCSSHCTAWCGWPS
jgi:hypothetical protein